MLIARSTCKRCIYI